MNAKKRLGENLKNQLDDFFQRQRELNLQTPCLNGEVENKEGFSSLANEAEREADSIQYDFPTLYSSSEEFDAVKPNSPPYPKLRPLVKAELIYEVGPTVTTKDKPCTMMQLAKLQERCSKDSKEIKPGQHLYQSTVMPSSGMAHRALILGPFM